MPRASARSPPTPPATNRFSASIFRSSCAVARRKHGGRRARSASINGWRRHIQIPAGQARFREAPPPRHKGAGESAGGPRRPRDRLRLHRKQAFALQFLARELARAPDRLGLLARPFFGGLLVMSAKLHFAEDSLTLHLLFQRFEGLIDIVVANKYLHGLSCVSRPSLR